MTRRRRRRWVPPTITPEMRRRAILRRLHLSDYAAGSTNDPVKLRERALEAAHILDNLAAHRIEHPELDEATINNELLDELVLEIAS